MAKNTKIDWENLGLDTDDIVGVIYKGEKYLSRLALVLENGISTFASNKTSKNFTALNHWSDNECFVPTSEEKKILKFFKG